MSETVFSGETLEDVIARRKNKQKEEELKRGKKAAELLARAERDQIRPQHRVTKPLATPAKPPDESIYPIPSVIPGEEPRSYLGRKLREVTNPEPKKTTEEPIQTRTDALHTRPLIHESKRGEHHDYLDEVARAATGQLRRSQ